MSLNTDNMAHLGGFASGLLVGLPLATSFTRSVVKNTAIHAAALVVIALLLGVGYADRARTSGYKNWMIHAAWSLDDKDYSTAIRVLEKGIAADPGNAEAEAWLGDAYALNNQPEKAIVAYKKTLELDPNLSDVKESLQDLQQAAPASDHPTK